MFKDVSQPGARPLVRVTLNGEVREVPAGHSVAAALLASGQQANRSSVVSAQRRGPYCLMGVCFECLVEVDGVANRQGCMTEVQEGMEIRFQHGSGEVAAAVVEEGCYGR